MVRIDKLNLAQRIVLVIGFAVVLVLAGHFFVHLGHHRMIARGWVGYAPFPVRVRGLFAAGLRPVVRVLIWLALLTAWVVVSVRLLRSRPVPEP